MGSDAVVVLDPGGQLGHDMRGARQLVHVEVVAFKSFHESLGHPVALWGICGRRADDEAQPTAEVSRRVGGVNRTVVREPFDGAWAV